MLQDIKLFLLDLDGTFYLGDQLLPGARELISYIDQKDDCAFAFLTNNSSRSAAEYLQKFTRFGFSFTEKNVLISSEATRLYLKKEYGSPKLFLAANPSVEEEFRQDGFVLTEEDAEVAVLAFDTSLTYGKLHTLCNLVHRGVPYIATHPDFLCPVTSGIMPDVGAMIAFVEAATGKKPLVIGKPNPLIIEMAAQKYHVKLSEIAMIGDRLYTDIAVGKNAGITSILVMSGETTPEMLRESSVQPDYCFENLADMLSHMK